jgi:hypothetical protein
VAARPAASVRTAAPVESAVKATVKRAPRAVVPAAVVIDYPMEGEIVASARYTFRIGTPAKEGIEVSVDGKDWVACRPSAGYWWYDWSGYGSGAHRIEARVPAGKRYAKSGVRSFTVLI